jgi:hypothetical protein
MAMPLLKDYLPPEEEPAASEQDATSGALSAQLDEHEAKLIRAERRAVALREAIERFVAAVRGSLPHLTEEDLFQVYQQIDAEDQDIGLASFEWGREQVEALRDAVLVREAQRFSSHTFWA